MKNDLSKLSFIILNFSFEKKIKISQKSLNCDQKIASYKKIYLKFKGKI